MSADSGKSLGYSTYEMMAIAAGREIKDGELAIFGVGLSMLAGFFAQACHAPRVRSITEGGIFGATPIGGLPWGIECNRLCATAHCMTGALDALGFLVASGRCDVGIIGAAQIDKFGNVNTNGIWGGPVEGGLRPPKVRLTGSGGANDIASGAKRTIVMLAHEKKRFANRVDYVTSPGFLDGYDARERAGLTGGGPAAIVTTLGVLRPHSASREFHLAGWFEYSNPDEVAANTGWALRRAPDARLIAPPSPAELAALRRVDETGVLRGR